MSGNELGTAFAREGFLDLRCPHALVRNSAHKSSRHVVRKSESLSWDRELAALRSLPPSPHFASP